MHSLDLIETAYKGVVEMYNELKDLPFPDKDDILRLKNMHDAVHTMLVDYCADLKKKRIPVEESYLSYWLEWGIYYENEDSIHYFIQMSEQ